MRSSHLLILCWVSSSVLTAQDPRVTHHFRAGFGPAIPAGGEGITDFRVSPALDFNYGLRPFRYLQFDIGSALDYQGYLQCNRAGCEDVRRRLTFLAGGIRGVLPLSRRFEVSAGAGGGYVWDQFSYPGNEPLLHFYGGISGALDEAGKYRLDVLTRFLRDAGRPTQQYVLLTFGLTWCPNCR